MFVGRIFWKSSLLESEKSEISFTSSNAVTSLIDLMDRFCAFPLDASQLFGLHENGLIAFAFDCFFVQDEQVCWQVHLQVTWLIVFQELVTHAIDSIPQTHTSSHIGLTITVNSIAVVSVLSFVGLPTMTCSTLPRLLYVYIGILWKSLFFPTHFPPQWSVYVYSC